MLEDTKLNQEWLHVWELNFDHDEKRERIERRQQVTLELGIDQQTVLDLDMYFYTTGRAKHLKVSSGETVLWIVADEKLSVSDCENRMYSLSRNRSDYTINKGKVTTINIC